MAKVKVAIVNGTNDRWPNNEDYNAGERFLKWFTTFEGVANNLKEDEELFIKSQKGLIQKCKVEKIEKDGNKYRIILKDYEKVFNKRIVSEYEWIEGCSHSLAYVEIA